MVTTLSKRTGQTIGICMWLDEVEKNHSHKLKATTQVFLALQCHYLTASICAIVVSVKLKKTSFHSLLSQKRLARPEMKHPR